MLIVPTAKMFRLKCESYRLEALDYVLFCLFSLHPPFE